MSTVMRRLGVIGLIQGVVFLAIYYASMEGGWLRTQAPLLLGLLYVTVAVPFAWYLTEGISGLSPRRRRVTVLVLGVVLAALGVAEGWAGADPSGEPRLGVSMLACLVLGFVGIPLLVHAERGGRSGLRWNYAALFQTAWHNAMMIAVATVLTHILWAVLFAGGALMRSIGLDLVWQAISRPWFYMPVTAAAFGCAMALAVVRADTIVSLRRFWLSMNQAFLSLVLFFSTMWTVALPFTGLDTLLKTHMAGFALLWFAALAVNFVNAANQDGLSPPSFAPWLRRALSWAWLTMPVVVGVAGFALFIRIGQYGWSADRVWGVFVWVMAAGYALGYAISSLFPKRGWMWSVGQTNVAMALVLCIGLIALSSPLADARRIAVNSQMERLLSGKTPPDTFDVRYLDERSGIYGRQAMQTLTEGMPGHPQAAQFAGLVHNYVRAKADRRQQQDAVDPTDDELRHRWHLLPDGTPAPPALLDALLVHLHGLALYTDEKKCLEASTNCLLWMGDLDGDNAPDLLLVLDQGWRRAATVYRWQPATAQLTRSGRIERVTKEWIAALLRNEVTTLPNPWRDIQAGGKRVQIVPVE